MKRVLSILLLFLLGIADGQPANDSLRQKLDSLLSMRESQIRVLEERAKRIQKDSLDIIALKAEIEELARRDASNLKLQVSELSSRDSLLVEMRKQKILGSQSFATHPVKINGDTLFSFLTKLGPIMPEDRATNVVEKIELLIEDDFFVADSLSIQPHELTVDIMYKDLIVTSITDWDALWEVGMLKEDLAPLYLDRIKTSIQAGKSQQVLQNIFARIGLVVLIAILVATAIYFLNRGISYGRDWLIKRKENYFNGIRIGTYLLLPQDRQIFVFDKSVLVFRWLVFILVLYASLPLLFSVFPFTRSWASILLGWILRPASEILWSVWNFVPNLFTIVVIYVITSYAVRLLKFVAQEIHEEKLKVPGFFPDWALPSYNIARFLIYAFMFIVIFPYLPGSDSEIFRGVSVFLGILFSLGSSSAIANAVAGLVITYMRPFKLGDRVMVGDVTGEITEKSLLVTRIRTSKNEDITVPNSSILTGHTTNFSSSSKEHGLLLHTTVTIGYDVPWRKVHELLVNAALKTEGVTVTKDPFVLQTSLDDWYVSYQLNAYTDMPERMPLIYSELHQNIQDEFAAANVEIMSPHYRAVRDGNLIAIPPVDPR